MSQKQPNWDRVKQMAQDIGISKDSQRMALLQEVFDPKVPERLTIIQDTKALVHMNYMNALAEYLGEEYGEFIRFLCEGERDYRMSTKGVSLDAFKTIFEAQQNASEITVRNESIPQQVTEKKGILSRIFGGGQIE